MNGIKTGYWSAAKKDELIQKLGKLEEYGERLLGEICVVICRHADEAGPKTPSELMERSMFCGNCPVKELAKMLGGEGK